MADKKKQKQKAKEKAKKAKAKEKAKKAKKAKNAAKADKSKKITSKEKNTQRNRDIVAAIRGSKGSNTTVVKTVKGKGTDKKKKPDLIVVEKIYKDKNAPAAKPITKTKTVTKTVVKIVPQKAKPKDEILDDIKKRTYAVDTYGAKLKDPKPIVVEYREQEPEIMEKVIIEKPAERSRPQNDVLTDIRKRRYATDTTVVDLLPPQPQETKIVEEVIRPQYYQPYPQPTQPIILQQPSTPSIIQVQLPNGYAPAPQQPLPPPAEVKPIVIEKEIPPPPVNKVQARNMLLEKIEEIEEMLYVQSKELDREIEYLENPDYEPTIEEEEDVQRMIERIKSMEDELGELKLLVLELEKEIQKV